MIEVLDHVEETLALPIDELVLDKPRVIAILTAIGEQIQELERANYALLTERSIDNGIGAQLDLIGRVVGEGRRGADDEPYRQRLRVRVLVNRSNARIPEILRILELFEGWVGTGNMHAREVGVMTLELEQRTPRVASIGEMRILLRRIKGAGVRLYYILATEPIEDMLILGWTGSDTTTPTSATQGLGWSGNMNAGGKLAHAEVITP